jgi:hypothetical protein
MTSREELLAGKVLILDAETRRDLNGIIEHVVGRLVSSSDSAADIVGDAVDDIFKLGSVPAQAPEVSAEDFGHWLFMDCEQAVYDCGGLAEEILKYFDVRPREGLAVSSTEAPAQAARQPLNETSRDWAVCRAVDHYRAPRNEGDERTLSDFLEEQGLQVSPLPSTQSGDGK